MADIDFNNYPVSKVFPSLKESWQGRRSFILQADPGAGKSTMVPLYLLREKMVKGRIIVLEPRRMAARSLARYMSSLLGVPVGKTVGYRVRGDVNTSSSACIELVTEGVFIRMIQDDPFLEDVDLVIMDEFHERNLFTDLSASFLEDVQANIRPDLKIMIMSATPEVEPLKKIFPDPLYLESRGRMFPVEIVRDEKPMDLRPDNSRLIRAVERGLQESSGNILVFLPGEREIISFLEDLERSRVPDKGVQLYPLFSRLKPAEQDRVLNHRAGRMIVAATSIAETSLTIPGISCVIDTGLERKPEFDANAGLSRLRTRALSMASADQRAGRAGRVEKGLCIRLWSENDERLMDDFSSPEILDADLSVLILEILRWGAGGKDGLKWMDPPPAAHYYQALELLRLLGVTDGEGQLTQEGKSLGSWSVHPRLAHMLERFAGTPLEQTACALAALLEEGDWMDSRSGSDIRLRLEYLASGRDGHKRKVKAIVREWESLLGRSRADRSALEPSSCARLLCHSFPDRIAGLRGDRVYQLSGGSNCRLRPEDPLQTEEFLIAPLVGGGGDIPSCFLAVPADRDLVLNELSRMISRKREWTWDGEKKKLGCSMSTRIGTLTMKSGTAAANTDDPDLAVQLKEIFRKKGVEQLPWTKEDRSLLDRLKFASGLKRAPGEWPDLKDEGLLDSMERWFLPILVKGRLEGGLKEGLGLLIDWEQRQFLDSAVPERFQVPSGSRIRIDYSDSGAPALEVRLQELFGLTETPLIAGEVPLLFKLLNPARRPIQVTRDLKSFWDNTYHEVRKELRGRYPKHYWPEDPYEGEATSRVRPKKR